MAVNLYVLSWSDFIRYDKDGNTVFDSRNMSPAPAIGTTLRSEPLIPHALENIGKSDIHIISIEIKQE